MFSKSSPAPATTTPEALAPKRSASSAAPARLSSAPSLLGQDLLITGDIKTDGEVQVDGRLEGNLTAGIITIGENGSVNGTISASRIHIRGKVTGKVDADVIELAETANVQADLVQDQLMIANGAFFDGKCARKTGVKKPTPITKAAQKA